MKRRIFFLIWMAVLPCFIFCGSGSAAEEQAAGVSGGSENSPAPDSGFSTHAEDEQRKLIPGDRIFVQIYPEDEYIKGGEMDVNSEGNITLPLIGKVSVAGMTIPDAEKELIRLIDADYLVNPEVAIELRQVKKELISRTFMALGQVKKPGSYPIPTDKPQFTLLEALSIAGGFTEIANPKRVKIITKVNDKRQTKQVNVEDIFNGRAPNVEIQNGDVINVAESLF